MKATAMCHGAATIITGFATGNGGAYGIGLENRTTVKLDGSGAVKSAVNGEEGVGVRLAEAAVRRALGRFGVEFTGAEVTTESSIPLAAGLKSSSVAANAVVLATVGALASERGEVREVRLGNKTTGQRISLDGRVIAPEEIINVGIDAAFDAKVTATGALDDASASYLGGYTITRNLEREIVRRGEMEKLKVLIHLPEGRIYSGEVKKEHVKAFAKEVDLIWQQALAGRIYSAITLNGMIHSIAFKQSMEPAVKALEAGAIAAGLSGTGPAVVALTRDDGKAVRDAWSALEGRVIETETRNDGARVVA